MKYFIDGNQLVVTKDSFINLQESEAVFIPLESEQSKIIQEKGFTMLPLGDLRAIAEKLELI